MLKNLIKFLFLTILLLLCMNLRGDDILSGLFHLSFYTGILTQIGTNSLYLRDFLFQILGVGLIIGVPFGTVCFCIYITYHSNIWIRSIGICYALFFIAFLAIPSLRYTTIGHEYTITNTDDIGLRKDSTDTMPTILSGSKFTMKDCDLDPDDRRKCIPILCNSQYGCFMLYGHADNEYYRLPQDPRRWYARIFF